MHDLLKIDLLKVINVFFNIFYIFKFELIKTNKNRGY
jgi:hypothetical protein